MNKTQKIILSIYFIFLAIGMLAMFVGNDGGMLMFSALIVGTPLAGILFFLWRGKK